VLLLLFLLSGTHALLTALQPHGGGRAPCQLLEPHIHAFIHSWLSDTSSMQVP